MFLCVASSVLELLSYKPKETFLSVVRDPDENYSQGKMVFKKQGDQEKL